MLRKTLQEGDEDGYFKNMTFYAGQTATSTTSDKITERLSFTDKPFQISPHKWFFVDESDKEMI